MSKLFLIGTSAHYIGYSCAMKRFTCHAFCAVCWVIKCTAKILRHLQWNFLKPHNSTISQTHEYCSRFNSRSTTYSLLYGLEACPLTKTDLQSLDFVVNRLFMKLFATSNIEIVKCCQEYFGFSLPSALLAVK